MWSCLKLPGLGFFLFERDLKPLSMDLAWVRVNYVCVRYSSPRNASVLGQGIRLFLVVCSFSSFIPTPIIVLHMSQHYHWIYLETPIVLRHFIHFFVFSDSSSMWCFDIDYDYGIDCNIHFVTTLYVQRFLPQSICNQVCFIGLWCSKETSNWIFLKLT